MSTTFTRGDRLQFRHPTLAHVRGTLRGVHGNGWGLVELDNGHWQDVLLAEMVHAPAKVIGMPPAPGICPACGTRLQRDPQALRGSGEHGSLARVAVDFCGTCEHVQEVK